MPTPFRTRIYFTALCLSLLGALGYFVFYKKEAGSTTSNRYLSLNLAPQSLEMGNVWETHAHVHRMTIENVSDAAVSISSFALSCSCTTIEPKSLDIPAREKRVITATVDLTPKNAKDQDAESFPFSFSITPILVGSSARQDSWVVKGSVRPVLRCDPPKAYLGVVSTLADAVTPFAVNVSSKVPLKEIVASIAGNRFGATVVKNDLRTQKYVVLVSPNKLPGGLGLITDELIL